MTIFIMNSRIQLLYVQGMPQKLTVRIINDALKPTNLPVTNAEAFHPGWLKH